MEKIEVGDGLTIIVQNPSDWLSRNNVNINLKIGSNKHKPKKVRAEIVSGTAYKGMMELGYGAQLELVPRTEDMDVSNYFESYERKGEVRLICKDLRHGTPYLATATSLNNVESGADFSGAVDLAYLLFGNRRQSSQLLDLVEDKKAKRRYIAFYGDLNKKLLEGLIDAGYYIKAESRVRDFQGEWHLELGNANTLASKLRITRMYRGFLQDDPIILKHLPVFK